MRTSFAVVALVSSLALAGCDQPHGRETRNFAWQGDLSGARWLRVRNLNGPVKVVRSPDARATIGVVVTGSRLGDLQLFQEEDEDGLTTCVVRGEGASCDAGHRGRGGLVRLLRRIAGIGDGDYSASYTVYVPVDARVDVGTVNGAVTVESQAREVRVKTVNGAVRMTAVGEAFYAESVNGSVSAELDLLGQHGAVELSTVNGSVEAELPASLGADVSMHTVNGKVRSDFLAPGTQVQGSAKQLSTVVGDGGHRVSLRTINGTATLKKRG